MVVFIQKLKISKMKIIGISGKIGSKKHILAENIRQQLTKRGVAVVSASFSDALKKCVTALVGVSNFNDDSKELMLEVMGISLGEYMQKLADHIRKFDDDVFVKALLIANATYLRDGSVIIIKDVRHKNEVEAIKSLNNLLVRVDAPANAKTKRSKEHKSETELDDYDQWSLRIGADGDIESLARSIVDVVCTEMNYKTYPEELKNNMKHLIEENDKA